MIKKREHNPELSTMGNMVLDLIDFKDRVRPLSQDISVLEYTSTHQKQNVEELLSERAEFKELMESMREEKKTISDSEGFSSGEIG